MNKKQIPEDQTMIDTLRFLKIGEEVSFNYKKRASVRVTISNLAIDTDKVFETKASPDKVYLEVTRKK